MSELDSINHGNQRALHFSSRCLRSRSQNGHGRQCQIVESLNDRRVAHPMALLLRSLPRPGCRVPHPTPFSGSVGRPKRQSCSCPCPRLPSTPFPAPPKNRSPPRRRRDTIPEKPELEHRFSRTEGKIAVSSGILQPFTSRKPTPPATSLA